MSIFRCMTLNHAKTAERKTSFKFRINNNGKVDARKVTCWVTKVTVTKFKVCCRPTLRLEFHDPYPKSLFLPIYALEILNKTTLGLSFSIFLNKDLLRKQYSIRFKPIHDKTNKYDK